MSDRYFYRLNYGGDLDEIFAQIADSFNLGQLNNFTLIPVGYEDVNFRVETDKGFYFVKIFASTRIKSDILRYVTNIEAALKAGVNHPSLLLNTNGTHLFSPDDTNLSLLVMDWVDGKSFWELNIKPNPEERKEIIKIATTINSIDHIPEFSYDSWAITSFLNEFEKFTDAIEEVDKQTIRAVAEKFKKVKMSDLPHAFVHGDLISTNLLKTTNKIFVVDFSVANKYPRIVELAVLFSNLLFDETNEEKSKSIYDESIKEYTKYINLTSEELGLIGLFTQVAHSMHVIGASKSVQQGEDGAENQYWLNSGRKGLSYSFY